MSRVIIVRRIAVSLAALAVVLLVVTAILGVTWVRRPFPTIDGEVAVPGLNGRVTVMRDDRGVPQIYADSSHDLFRAQGFVHAQDRFFEMDLRRHITAGRLSELVGPSGLETDKVIRTLGWRRVAEAELPMLAPETRQYLQAYADGVNAYVESQGSPSRMAFEYVVLGQRVKNYRVERWTPADSLAWLKAMAWDLRGDYQSELTRARLFGRVPTAQINELYPAYPYAKHKPILSTQDWRPEAAAPASAVPGAAPSQEVPLRDRTGAGAQEAYAAVHEALSAIPESVGRGRGIGSNSWVVGPEKSSTGKPLLANDPHLAVGIPGIWHQVGLHCRSVGSECPFDVSGFSFAGLPGVVIGHNQQIAWGFTNLDPDVTDFYLEQVRGGTYLRDGKYVALEERTETIKIAGEGDHTMTVRNTVHGPLVSEVIDPVGEGGERAPVSGRPSAGSYEVALAWTGLIPSRTADAIFGLNTATNFEEFRTAAKSFAVPCQNLIYADTRRPHRLPGPGHGPGPAIRRPPARCPASGPWRAGARRGTGRASSTSRTCPGPTTRPRASSSPRTRPSRRARPRSSPPEWDYGFRSSGSAPCWSGRTRSPRSAWPRSRATPAARSPPPSSSACSRSSSAATSSPRRARTAARLGLQQPHRASPTPARPPPTSTRCGPTCSSSPSTTSCPTTSGRRGRPVDADRHRAARQAAQPVVGRQADPRRHRG